MRILFFVSFIPFFSFGQLSPKVDKLYQQLSKSERAEGKNISMDGHESELYKLHLELGKIATDKEAEYIAFNGKPVAKYYAANILFDRKSESLEKLFKYYLRNRDSVRVLEGCISGVSGLGDEIYLNVISEKQIIDQAEWEKKWKDSMIANKKQNTPEYLNLVDMLDTETNWTHKEIDSLVYKFDQTILDNQESSQSIVELIAGFNEYEKIKLPYYQKLIYFEKKYNSKVIRKYIEYCSN
ncbi:hypothetical protein HNP38_000625 [Chryseobacterium defluvii]|uniref:Uncharacterized protein n=1 Tax=Chryseobacterium defluvii TaxID=160396 RepID=A0A840KCT9_9FLAO|nr:hypothetical protein [Chryseobacterium defluvii]MBB4805353.1 hypothetical protein [Chryseobacterium defluvii]